VQPLPERLTRPGPAGTAEESGPGAAQPRVVGSGPGQPGAAGSGAEPGSGTGHGGI